jgi:hypothetical protein
MRGVVRMLDGSRSVEQVERILDEAIRHWQAYGFGRWVIRRDDLRVINPDEG